MLFVETGEISGFVSHFTRFADFALKRHFFYCIIQHLVIEYLWSEARSISAAISLTDDRCVTPGVNARASARLKTQEVQTNVQF